jgi:hypothetical protein
MVIMKLDGVEHAVSLDFGAKSLDDILEYALPGTNKRIRSWLVSLRGVATLDIPEGILFGARASLGEEQRAEREVYVPLLV